jgi:hypothetical protein
MSASVPIRQFQCATLQHHRLLLAFDDCEFGSAHALEARETMPDYRAYIVGADGHFKSAEVIMADDDENAVRIAEKLVDGHDVELWQLDRKVIVLPRKN